MVVGSFCGLETILPLKFLNWDRMILKFFISISFPEQNNMCLGLLYHPPSSSTALLDTMLDTIYDVNPFTFSQFFLIGDFNTNMLVHSSNRDYVLSLCNHFNLSQMVRIVLTYVVMAIAHFWTLSLCLIQSVCCIVSQNPLGNSDHHGILLCLDYPLLTKELDLKA